jgi:hypothetical protein
MNDAALVQEENVKTLRISSDLKLPLEAVTQTFAILAMRGVGKTHTASVLAEELCEARLPFVVLDPTGAWWGLRATADGKGEGYPVTILGGDHADAPLEETAGKVVAEMLAEEARPLVLDLSHLSKGAMRRFVADFAERLYEKNRDPLHLIIDEADAFAPQKPRPDEMRMLGALDEIVRRGRIRGLGCTLVTQRSAVLNKDVLTQAEVLVVLRTAHPRDRAPVLEWMKVHATPEQLGEVEASLAKLPKGDAWVMSAGWLDLFARIHVRERRTFNSSATPKPGERRIQPAAFARIDPAVLQERLANAIERQKAADPALLRKRIAELEREVAKKPAAAAPASKADPTLAALVRQLRKAVDQAMKFLVTINAESFFKAGGSAIDRKEIEKAIGAAVANVTKLLEARVEYRNREIERLQKEASRVLSSLKALASDDVAVEVTVRHNEPFTVAPRPSPTRAAARPPAEGELELRRGERRMLEVLARTHPARRTRAQLGTLAGFTPSGGTFGTYFGVLKRHGLIVEEADGSVSITEAGLALVGGAPAEPHTPEEVLETWRRALRSGERAMLDELVSVYPKGLSREELGQRTSFTHTGGTFGTYLGVLRRNGLAEIEGDEVRASETLFLAR